MGTQPQGGSILDHKLPVGKISPEELFHHAKGFLGRNDFGILVYIHKVRYVCRVVRFHMLDDQIIRLSAIQNLLNINQPFCAEIHIDRIHDGYLLIHDDIGVISHSVGNLVLSLEQVYIMIIDTDIFDVICNIHSNLPY